MRYRHTDAWRSLEREPPDMLLMPPPDVIESPARCVHDHDLARLAKRRGLAGHAGQRVIEPSVIPADDHDGDQRRIHAGPPSWTRCQLTRKPRRLYGLPSGRTRETATRSKV